MRVLLFHISLGIQNAPWPLQVHDEPDRRISILRGEYVEVVSSSKSTAIAIRFRLKFDFLPAVVIRLHL